MPHFTLDNFASAERSAFGTRWECLTDESMGGTSTGNLIFHTAEAYAELRGQTHDSEHLKYTEPFVEWSLPLLYSRQLFDAREYRGVRLRCASELPAAQEQYAVHLHTRELSMPWQYYRQNFVPGEQVQWFELPFTAFEAVNTNHPLNPAYLLSLGVVTTAPESYLKLFGVEFYA